MEGIETNVLRGVRALESDKATMDGPTIESNNLVDEGDIAELSSVEEEKNDLSIGHGTSISVVCVDNRMDTVEEIGRSKVRSAEMADDRR